MSLRGGEPEAPVCLQTTIILKLLTFDRNLKTKPGSTINITVLYQKDYRPSYNVMKEISQQEWAFNKFHFEGKKIALRYEVISSAQDFISDGKPSNIIIVTPMRAIDLSAISSACDARGILSVSTVAEYVEQGYFSVGIGLKGDKPQPVINLYKVKREGADFSSRLLDLSKIVNK